MHGCFVNDIPVNNVPNTVLAWSSAELAMIGHRYFRHPNVKGVKVIGLSTHAEDLAEPVADNERQLALLTLIVIDSQN
jgi:altronate dehydratase